MRAEDLNWKVETPPDSPKYFVAGVDLEYAFADDSFRFMLTVKRTIGEDLLPSTIITVRDASLVTLQEVQDGAKTPTVAQFDTAQEALDFVNDELKREQDQHMKVVTAFNDLLAGKTGIAEDNGIPITRL